MATSEFAHRLRWLRENRDWSQVVLATKTGLSPQMIQSWEDPKKTTKPRRQNVIKVARALSVDPDELLALADHDLLDDEERAEELDEDKQRLDTVWLRLNQGQRHHLVEFMESMTGGRPPNNVRNLGVPVEPGSARVPPPRYDDPTDDD